MAIKQNKYSVAKVVDSRGRLFGFLSARDEERGLDIQLDSQGYTIIAL